jgi:branched-chain amino acid transport system substrate-binding protein
LKLSLAATGSALAAPWYVKSAAAQQGPIRIAAIYDQSGGLAIYGRGVVQTTQFAVEQVNAEGGVNGRQIELLVYDTQSDMQNYAQFATEAAVREQVDVVFGGITSASREVIRPLLRRYGVPLVYSTFYEGGVCDANTIISGTTSNQTVRQLVPHAVSEFGPKLYHIGADYNAPRIIGDWTQKFLNEAGGELVGNEFIPLDVGEFGASIARIQNAQPDVVFSNLVGAAHVAFYRSWAAAGLLDRFPLMSIVFGAGNEHLLLPAEETNGILAAYGYFQELELPENQLFVEGFKTRFGKEAEYLNAIAYGGYEGVMVWACAAEQAGSTEHAAVLEVLSDGFVWQDSPAGRISFDPLTNHFVRDIHLAELQDRQWRILQSFSNQYPGDMVGLCDLVKDPSTNMHFQPEI